MNKKQKYDFKQKILTREVDTNSKGSNRKFVPKIRQKKV